MSERDHRSIATHVIGLHSQFHNQPLPFSRVLEEYPNADDRTLAIVVAADIEASREWDFPVTYARYRSIKDLEHKPLTVAAIATAFQDTEDVIRALEAEETGEDGDAPALSPKLPLTRSGRSGHRDLVSRGGSSGGFSRNVQLSFIAVLALIMGGAAGWFACYRWYGTAGKRGDYIKLRHELDVQQAEEKKAAFLRQSRNE